MKNKRLIYIIIIILLLLCLVTGIYLFVNNKKTGDLKLNVNEVANITKVDIDIPEFIIAYNGLYNGLLTNINLKEKSIPIYEFDATVYNGWENVTNHYVGVKLKDVLESLNITDYSKIEFEGAGQVKVVYELREISDKTFLMFYRDGEELNKREPAVNLLAVDHDYRFSIQSIQYMTFK